MSAGERHCKVKIQRSTVDENRMGGRSDAVWSTICEAWASVTYGTGSERRVAAQEGSTVSATFRVPSSSQSRAINPKDRLLISGEEKAWDIISAVPAGHNVSVDITAKRDG